MAPGFDDRLAIHRMYELLLSEGQTRKPHHYSAMDLRGACVLAGLIVFLLGGFALFVFPYAPRLEVVCGAGHMDWSDFSSLG
jgi:hypothetical protein